jgi:protein TonB
MTEYLPDRSRPSRRLAALVLATVLHVAVIYGLTHGLASRVIEIVNGPVQAKIVDDLPPPPPPPPLDAVPQPTLVASPAAPYFPPPEVHISAPPPVTAEAISSFTSVRPS